MDGAVREMWARMPLAEAVLQAWRWLADDAFLEDFYQRHRGRGRRRTLSFAVLLQLIADALVHRGGSARRAFERAREEGELDVSIQAAYGKLRRMPIETSVALLAQATQRLRALAPVRPVTEAPSCLAHFHVVVLDGKAIKRIAKRLKPLRGVSGGVVGGKALVALCLQSGLAFAMHADPDGDANEVRFVPQFVPAVRRLLSGRRLWLLDRAFGYPKVLELLAQEEDHFLVRQRRVVTFTADPTRPPQTGQDATGRAYTQSWGWVGRPGTRTRRVVRRIVLSRPGADDVALLTDLLDAQQYPAEELLRLYRMRWGIEQVFQQVTEVFGLQTLIGSSPEASVFQLAFCLLLYNVMQVVRAHVAAGRQLAVAEVSIEKLFEDVREQLQAWRWLIGPRQTFALFGTAADAAAIGARLHALLATRWRDRWRKATQQKRRPATPTPRARIHQSAHRLITGHQRR